MYNYIWDPETGGYLLDTKISGVTKELRPVFHEELDLLGFNQYWEYEPSDKPLLWVEMRRYFYHGELVAEANGGGLYTKPTLKIHKSPLRLEPIDIEEMVNRNRTKMAALIQNTVEEIYSQYNEYKNKVDITYVAFSGGKDSIVLLDLVQKTLPNDAFKVIFSDTTMEISDTYKAVDRAKKRWPKLDFFTAKSHLDAKETWRLFAPPAKINRWCCSVHKSVPSLLLLRNIVGSHKMKAFAFDGVRAEESDSRSSYSTISDGHKHTTQINCSPLLNWGTDELFLYLFDNNLLLNDAYRYGSTRVGCALCPMSSPWRDFITFNCYYDDAKRFIEIIEKYAQKTGITSKQMDMYLEKSGWRNRAGGRGLAESNNLMIREDKQSIHFSIISEKTDWTEWIKSIGNPIPTAEPDVYDIGYKNVRYKIKHSTGKRTEVKVFELKNSLIDKRFIYCMRNIFGKVAYCVSCKACEVECPTGALTVNSGKIKISEKCIKCEKCLEKTRGCLAAKSFYSTLGGKNGMRGMHRYGTFGFRFEWLKLLQQYGNTDFWQGDKLGPDQYDGFKKWLLDSEILNQNNLSDLGYILLKMPINSNFFWGVLATNLSYNSIIFNWYINKIESDIPYTKNDLVREIGDDYPERTRVNALSSLISTFADTPLANNAVMDYRKAQGGFFLDGLLARCEIKGKKVFSITRISWQSPDSLVILYALYKFAEKCDGHYSFTLSYLCDDSIEREGISPTRIFGITPENMKEILISLSRSQPDFIGVEFQKDLDNIDLNRGKSSFDVLGLL